MHCSHCEDLARRISALEDALVEMSADLDDMQEDVAEHSFDLNCLFEAEEELEEELEEHIEEDRLYIAFEGEELE